MVPVMIICRYSRVEFFWNFEVHVIAETEHKSRGFLFGILVDRKFECMVLKYVSVIINCNR